MKPSELKNLELTAGQLAAVLGTSAVKINELERAGRIPTRGENKKFKFQQALMSFISANANDVDIKNARGTGQDLASILGLSSARISVLEKDGMFSRGKDNLFPMAQSVQAYVNAIKEKIKKDSPSDMFETARAKKMIATAQIEEMELQKRQGSLVEISDVTDIVGAEYAIVRQRLFAIPNKIALDVFSCDTPQQVQEVMISHLNEALNELKFDVGRETTGVKTEHTEAVADDIVS